MQHVIQFRTNRVLNLGELSGKFECKVDYTDPTW
ncbi:hypothetical protein TcasGA2_TC032837 [Tribolium castaneum]|uniref:Uncharacterized protein n=1 Tax=Tribolium castaneum TaxID=7070 RepID=A0A139WJ87_TRICA|nr:hypothetical protein TcasGA2_TC032837 [Tribolium castaneum]